MIKDMTKADLQAQDEEFEVYLQENGWEGNMKGSIKEKTQDL